MGHLWHDLKGVRFKTTVLSLQADTHWYCLAGAGKASCRRHDCMLTVVKEQIFAVTKGVGTLLSGLLGVNGRPTPDWTKLVILFSIVPDSISLASMPDPQWMLIWTPTHPPSFLWSSHWSKHYYLLGLTPSTMNMTMAKQWTWYGAMSWQCPIGYKCTCIFGWCQKLVWKVSH